MRYLLDANAVIALLKDRRSAISSHVQQQNPSEIGIPAIVAQELFYGAFKSQRADHNLAIFDALQFEVVDFDKVDARAAGEVRAFLAKRGTPIGPYDVLIAGQAKARGLVLITRNTDEFARVPDLVIENWEV